MGNLPSRGIRLFRERVCFSTWDEHRIMGDAVVRVVSARGGLHSACFWLGLQLGAACRLGTCGGLSVLLGFEVGRLLLGGIAGPEALVGAAAGIGWFRQGEADLEGTAYRPPLRAGEGVEARNCPAWGRDDGVRGQVRGAMTDAFRWSRVLPGFTCGRGLRLGPSCASHRCRRRLVMEMLASPAPPGLDRGAGGKVVTVPSVLVRSWFPRTRWL